MSNAGQLRLTAKPDGVAGTYTVAGKAYPFESTFLSKRAMRARILRPDNSVLVECLREGDDMTVSLPTGSLVIELVKQSPFSESESKALSSFLVTEDAAIVRGLLYNLSLHRKDGNQKLLVGFAVMAMFLGEGRTEGVSASSPKAGRRLAAASQKVSYLESTAAAPALSGECHGCCGPGCWGCSGCYTEACRLHDNCTNENGYLTSACDALLVVAVASMTNCLLNE